MTSATYSRPVSLISRPAPVGKVLLMLLANLVSFYLPFFICASSVHWIMSVVPFVANAKEVTSFCFAFGFYFISTQIMLRRNHSRTRLLSLLAGVTLGALGGLF